MRDPLRSTSSRILRAALAIFAAGAGLAAIYSCSLIVDTQSQQCQSTADCTLLSATATCDMTMHVCMSGSTSSGSTSSGSSGSSSSTSSGAPTCNVDGGIDGGGCYSATCLTTMSTDSELLNACTTGCIPFMGKVTLFDGGVPPQLPMPGPNDAGM